MFRTRQSKTISIACGAAVFTLSAAVLLGWKLELPWLISLQPNWSAMVITTAVCFLLSGFALLGNALLSERYRLHTKRSVAFILFFITGLRSLELIVGTSFGIDLALRNLFHITYQMSGLMGVGTTVSFMLFSIGLILHERIQYSITGIRMITATLFSIGLITVIDYGLKLEYFYEWIGTVHMALHVAIGMMMLSLGLWSLWADAAASQFFRQKNEAQAIQRRSTIIVIVAICSAGLMGFGLLRFCVEKIVQDNLNQLATDRRLFFSEIIQHRLRRAAVAEKSVDIQRLSEALEHAPPLTINESIQKAFQPLIAHGFTGLAVERNGSLLSTAGSLPLSPEMIVPIETSITQQAQLIWHQQHYLLRTRLVLSKTHTTTTTIILDQTLPILTDLAIHKLAFGESAVTVVCHEAPSTSICFPNQHEPAPFQVPKAINSQILPMTYALQQQSGISVTKDYREKRVIAAYGPIGSLGLGMVIKMDLTEIYLPIKKQFHMMLPLILGLIAAWLWWIKKSIHPLIATVIQSRQQLAESLKWRSAILESAAVSVISTNTLGTISSFNKAAQRMFGYTEVEMVNRQAPTILHDSSELLARAHELNSELGLSLQAGFEVLVAKARLGLADEHEWTYIRKDHTRLSVSLAVTALRNPEGIILGFLCIAYDLTERKKIERLKNEFISTVSHELRTPLTSIRGSLGLLVAGTMGEMPARAMTLLNIASTNCERLVRLINDFLDLEKMESGNMQFNMVVQPFMPVVEQSIQSMQSFATQFHVTFVLQTEGTIGYANIDTDRISQAIVNLLSNAAKFALSGSQVDIKASQHNNRVRFSVTNYGQGIPEAYRGRIFGKFMQINDPISRQRGGTGLGLNISKTIIEKHLGIIDFKSEVDQYTEFFFELPAVLAPAITLAPAISLAPANNDNHPAIHKDIPVEKAPAPQKPALKILICEHNPDIAKLLSYMLAQENFETDIAYNAEEAKRNIASVSYAAIVLDMNLPDDDGVFLITSLRSEEKTRYLPIIIISIEAEPSSKDLQEKLLIKDWITKPLDELRLRKALQSALMLDSKDSSTSTLPVVLHIEADLDLVQVIAELLQSKCKLIHAPTLEAAHHHLNTVHFNAIILDIELPDGSGKELFTSLPSLNATTPILIFSGLEVQCDSLKNVCAMLVKSRSSDEQLVTTVCTVLNIPFEKPAE